MSTLGPIACFVRHTHQTRWCAAIIGGDSHAVTRCGARLAPDDVWEVADETPPLVDRCRRCEPTAMIAVGLRELAACAIEVSFDCYERLAARGEPGAVASQIIDEALDEEMGAS